MKLPVIRHLHKTNSRSKIENAIEVLETFCEYRRISDQELDVIGELLTNLCGAAEVHQMVENGMNEREAATAFAQKVMGSIDR